MKDSGEVYKNTLYLIISQLLSRVVNFYQIIVLVRYLGKGDYGVWSLVLSLPAMFLVLTDVGLNSIILRKIAREKNKLQSVFHQVLIIKLFLSVLFMSVVYVFARISAYELEVQTLIIISSVACVLTVFSEMVVFVLRACENFAVGSLLEVARSIVFLLAILAIVRMDLGLIGIAVASVGVSALSAIFMYAVFGRRYCIGFEIYRFSEYKKLLIAALPFAFYNLINPIFMQLDIVMLSKLSTFESVGIYAVAYKVVTLLYYIPIAFKNALFPNLSSLYAKSHRKFSEKFEKACRIMVLVGLPLAIGLILLSDKLVLLIFSSEYAESSLPLKILGVSVYFFYMRMTFSSALYTSNSEYLAVGVLVGATILNVLLDFLLIPKLHYTGAALATLCAEIVMFVCYYVAVKRKGFVTGGSTTGIRIAVAVGLMGGMILLTTAFSVFFQVLLCIAFYAFLMWAFKVLRFVKHPSGKRRLTIGWFE